jgi:phage terminase Nu1 subunit (DNA packaging protein)
MDVNNSEILSVLFRRCINFLSRKRQKIAKNVGGIPESQSRILRELLQTDGMSQKELLQKLQIRQPSLRACFKSIRAYARRRSMILIMAR